MARFIAALRTSGARISLAESADAFRAVETLGVTDKSVFRLAMRATLIKEKRDLPTYDNLFPLFFGRTAPPLGANLLEALSPEEMEQVSRWLEDLEEHLRQRLEELLSGEALTDAELDSLGNRLGLSRVDSLQYLDWLTRRIERAVGLDEVRQLLEQLLEVLSGTTPAERAASLEAALTRNLEAWQQQIRQFVGQGIAENLSELPRQQSEKNLLDLPFSALSEQEMNSVRDEARRLATMLKSKIALRQKKDHRGLLDPKSTIRSNLRNYAIPIEIKRRKRVRKPKVVIMCDVSTSMRYCSELMLTMLFYLSDLVSKTHAFAFIDHLEYVSPHFDGKTAGEAVLGVLQKMPPGYYSTDLGASLKDLDRRFLDTIDSRTSFIVVGDARNNFNDPQMAIFQKLARRAHRTIWINPESQAQWGTGDSDMWKYQSICSDVLQARNLRELSNAIDLLLA
ncbi:MAG: VWA domain-containing protein [Chloroflexi bacterium]|nr:VWA domain-containing protein [Chloroflexota bacterium]